MDSQGLLKVTHLLNLSDAGRVARVSHPLVPDQSQVRDLEGKETVLAKWGGVTERYRKLRLRSNLPHPDWQTPDHSPADCVLLFTILPSVEAVQA